MASAGTDQIIGGTASSQLDGDYTIDFSAALPWAGAGQPAFAAHSKRAGQGFMAVQAELGWPVRPRALSAAAGAPIPHMLTPLAHGSAAMPSGAAGYFVICPAAMGRPLSADPAPWPERDLLEYLLRPAALALAALHARDVTHRDIRTDNLFHAGAADPVVLGAAWAAPPACRQPCVYEPPYSAICLPAGRGDGAPADDIYALGVAMVILALGRDPMAGQEPGAIIRSKLDQGSFEALIGRNRLPTAIAELARGMLADDPEHRPSAILLGDPAAARARRAAARPQRRGQRSFILGDTPADTTQDLAQAIMARPDLAPAQLRNGAIPVWLRRTISDGAMAAQIDEITRMREEATHAQEPAADPLMACRAVAVLDPLAPLTWRRLALWPDGLGAALNHALHTDPAQAGLLTEIAANDVLSAFAAIRPQRSDTVAAEGTTRVIRTALGGRQMDQGALRLNFTLNALAPCESPLLAGQWVARLGDLLPALESAAAGPLRSSSTPVDRHIAAFIGIRRDDRAPADLSRLANLANPADPMSQLRLLARLQAHCHPDRLPALTSWLAELVAPEMVKFHSKARRTEPATRIAALTPGGMLPALVAVLDDPRNLATDVGDYEAAVIRGAEIDAELASIGTADPRRRDAALRSAHDITNGISLAACGLALAAAAFL